MADEATTTATTPAPESAPVAAAAPTGEASSSSSSSEASLISAATEAPKEGGKPPEVAKADDKPPEVKATEYTEFKLPEGLKADDTLLGTFRETASKAGISQDQAQALIDAFGGKLVPADLATKAVQDVYDQWKSTQQQWVEAVKADPEIGGANFDGMKSQIAKMINEVGGAEAQKFRDALNFTGAGNNPDIIRFVYRLAKAFNEGGHVKGGGPAKTGQTDPFSSAAGKLYTGTVGLGNQSMN